MSQEIEKKFLLSSLPVGVANPVVIKQGYLSVGDPEVRVRQKGKKFFATAKSGEGLVRDEAEEEISSAVFNILWPATAGARVKKVRYSLVGLDGLTWEIDLYTGALEGLIIAEVEMASATVDPKMPRAIKAVFIADVTCNSAYKNKNLAVKGSPRRVA